MVGILALISALKDLSRVFLLHCWFLRNVFQAFRQIVVIILILRCVPSTLHEEICRGLNLSHRQMGPHRVLWSLDKSCIWTLIQAHVEIIDSLLGSLRCLLEIDSGNIVVIFVTFVKLADRRLIILDEVAIFFYTDKDIVPKPILAVLHLSKLHLPTNLAL